MIGMIELEITSDSGYFMPKKPKQGGARRSVVLINNEISKAKRMHKHAATQQYISLERIPSIERLREQSDKGCKRDIFKLEEHEEH